METRGRFEARFWVLEALRRAGGKALKWYHQGSIRLGAVKGNDLGLSA